MTDHTVDYSGLTPGERHAYIAALGTAELAMEWLQQPAINEAFRSWVARTYPEITATNGRQLEPTALDLMADLFAMQILVLLPESPDEADLSAAGVANVVNAATRAFERQAARLTAQDTDPEEEPPA